LVRWKGQAFSFQCSSERMTAHSIRIQHGVIGDSTGQLDAVTASFEARSHSPRVVHVPRGRGRSSIRLLLSRLLPSFVPPAKRACKASHSRSRGSSLAGVTRYSAADCAQGGTAARATQNVRLRRSVRLWIVIVWIARVSSARIEARLPNRPGMTFVAVSILLFAALLLEGIDVKLRSLSRCRSGQQSDQQKTERQPAESGSVLGYDPVVHRCCTCLFAIRGGLVPALAPRNSGRKTRDYTQLP